MTHASSTQFSSQVLSATCKGTDCTVSSASPPLSSVERPLVRLLALGYALEDVAGSVGLSPAAADLILRKLQDRCGASSLSRLLALAVLRHWV